MIWLTATYCVLLTVPGVALIWCYLRLLLHQHFCHPKYELLNMIGTHPLKSEYDI